MVAAFHLCSQKPFVTVSTDIFGGCPIKRPVRIIPRQRGTEGDCVISWLSEQRAAKSGGQHWNVGFALAVVSSGDDFTCEATANRCSTHRSLWIFKKAHQ